MASEQGSHWMENWLEQSKQNRKREAEEDAEIAALYVERPPNPIITREQMEYSAHIALLTATWSQNSCDKKE